MDIDTRTAELMGMHTEELARRLAELEAEGQQVCSDALQTITEVTPQPIESAPAAEVPAESGSEPAEAQPAAAE